MKTRLHLIGTLVACLLTIAGPALAHHTWHGYDMENITSVKGTVTQFGGAIPVWISFELTNDKGAVEKMERRWPKSKPHGYTGWDKEMLKPGDQITAVGHRIKDGTYNLRLVKVVMSDGRELICYGGR